MRSLASLFLRLDKATTHVAGLAASLALAIAVAAGFWQVVSRFLLQSPATWSEALVRLALIWMVMLGLSVALRQGALVSIDIAHRYSSGRARYVIETMTLISNLILMTTLMWFGIQMTQRVWFQEMAGLDVSISWGYAAIPVGCIFAAIGTIAHYLDIDRRNEELESAV
jgi:TRAP-type C4-dicarboxylate transport system permease small subunit